jgi:RHS repeat-associated protein
VQFTNNTYGVATATFGAGPGGALQYSYSYWPAGELMGQSVSMTAEPGNWTAQSRFGAGLSYYRDTEGRLTSDNFSAGGIWQDNQYQYDAMGRLNQVQQANYLNPAWNIVATAAYTPTSQLSTLWNSFTSQTESFTYNSLLQLTRDTVPGLMDMQYIYTAGQNNGRVAETIDGVSGETVQYAYDSLQRLASAQTTGSSGPQWGEVYTYDGFGNLTGKNVTKGSAPAVSFQYDPGTNQPINQFFNNPNNPPQNNFDANGNAPVGTWDIENHLVQQTLDGQAITWAYYPSGKRVLKYQANVNGAPQWTFYLYNDRGQRLAEVTCTNANGCAPTTMNTYFGGKLIAAVDSAGHVLGATDRLGTVRAVQTSGTWAEPTYYPYGEQHTAGGVDGKEQFGTYVRDSTPSAQDYAMARYYSNNTGRFFTPDFTGGKSADVSNPASWNRYAYVNGDPVNLRDPSGRYAINEPDCNLSGLGMGDGSVGSCSVFVDDTDWGDEAGDMDLCAWANTHAVAFWLLDAYDCAESGGGGTPAPPPQISLKEIDDCIYPSGIGVTALTATFTLEVEYQVLVNGSPVYGNSALNALGISISELVGTTSGPNIVGGGAWCPNGGSCDTAGSMTSTGTFWDMLAGSPSGYSTANQTFLFGRQPIAVSFPGTAGSSTILKNTYNSQAQSITVGNGALSGTSSTRTCGKSGDPGQ